MRPLLAPRCSVIFFTVARLFVAGSRGPAGVVMADFDTAPYLLGYDFKPVNLTTAKVEATAKLRGPDNKEISLSSPAKFKAIVQGDHKLRCALWPEGSIKSAGAHVLMVSLLLDAAPFDIGLRFEVVLPTDRRLYAAS